MIHFGIDFFTGLTFGFAGCIAIFVLIALSESRSIDRRISRDTNGFPYRRRDWSDYRTGTRPEDLEVFKR